MPFCCEKGKCCWWKEGKRDWKERTNFMYKIQAGRRSMTWFRSTLLLFYPYWPTQLRLPGSVIQYGRSWHCSHQKLIGVGRKKPKIRHKLPVRTYHRSSVSARDYNCPLAILDRFLTDSRMYATMTSYRSFFVLFLHVSIPWRQNVITSSFLWCHLDVIPAKRHVADVSQPAVSMRAYCKWPKLFFSFLTLTYFNRDIARTEDRHAWSIHQTKGMLSLTKRVLLWLRKDPHGCR